MPGIGDFIRRSLRSPYKISKCVAGFEKQKKKKNKQTNKTKTKGKSHFFCLTGARGLQPQLSCKIT